MSLLTLRFFLALQVLIVLGLSGRIGEPRERITNLVLLTVTVPVHYTPEEAQLTFKPPKVHLCKRVVQYGGHMLKDVGTFQSPTNFAAIKEWKRESIVTANHMKSFLGLMGWYQVYIKGFAELVAPLINALKSKYQYEPKDANELKTATRVPKRHKKIKFSPKQAPIHWTDEMK